VGVPFEFVGEFSDGVAAWWAIAAPIAAWVVRGVREKCSNCGRSAVVLQHHPWATAKTP